MSSPTVGTPSPQVSQLEFDGELSLFDARTGRALALNRTASGVWALADGVRTVDEVVASLGRAYGVPDDDIRADVVATLDELVRLGVLEPPAA